jgi:ethanolamine utilization protein EutQ
MKRVITAELVAAEFERGARRINALRADTIVTPAAWSRAVELGVTIDQDGARPAPLPGAPAGVPAPTVTGSAERMVDPAGLVVVRSGSVKLGTFTGAGPGKNIGLMDLVTGRDGSPMTAGIMSWRREDSFPWHLDYDEIDLVLEGVLEIELDGRKHRAGPGDVVYIPKGSRIVFGTPSHTRVFYVTYPADWSAPAAARPSR